MRSTFTTTFARITRGSAALLLTAASMYGCGSERTPQTSTLQGDPDYVEVEITAATRPAVNSLLAKFAAARAGTGSFKVADLIGIVALEPTGLQTFQTAYPTAFTTTCNAAVCKFTGMGAAARARTVASEPGLQNVSIGVRASIRGGFTLSSDGKTAIICDGEGVYFARSIFRKNLRAYRIEVPAATGGRVTLWMSGAADTPACPT